MNLFQRLTMPAADAVTTLIFNGQHLLREINKHANLITLINMLEGQKRREFTRNWLSDVLCHCRQLPRKTNFTFAWCSQYCNYQHYQMFATVKTNTAECQQNTHVLLKAYLLHFFSNPVLLFRQSSV